MNYAVIGWGSLLWDLDSLAPRVSGDWLLDQGPGLPLEFVYVSTKRNAALTVVVDETHGDVCVSSVIASHRTDVREAQNDLAEREHTTAANIGMLDLRSGRSQSRSEAIAGAIRAWLEISAFDGAVWTDTGTNFESVTGQPFSVAHGARYLRSLGASSLLDAKHYIESAPTAVSTPLRRHLHDQDWWHTIATR